MKDNSVLKVGGTFAILLGIAKFVATVAYFIVPPEQRLDVPGVQLLPSVAKDSTVLFLIFWLEAFAGVVGLGVVPAVSRLVRDKSEGWVRWAGALATVGFAVSAVGYLLTIARLPTIAAAYVKGDASTQAALAAVWKSSPDLLGFWGYGAIGIWILIVSLLLLRGGPLPKTLNTVGVLLAVDALGVPVAQLLKSGSLIAIIAAAGAVLVPVWCIWIGLTLRRSASAA